MEIQKGYFKKKHCKIYCKTNEFKAGGVEATMDQADETFFCVC